MKLRIAIGADVSAYQLKTAILEELHRSHLVDEVIDVGVTSADDQSQDHVQVGIAVASRVADGSADRGLVFCGNGLGVTLAANTVAGVDAVTAHDLYSVRTSVSNNGAQVLCMGAKVIGPEPACMLVAEWLATPMPPRDAG